MSTALELLVAIIAQIVSQVLPSLGSSQTTQLVSTIITMLQKVLPDIIAAGEELATTTQNIIAALKGTDGVTPEQWAALDAFETKIDAEALAAAKDEGFDLPAAEPPSPTS